ncbi:MAG: thiamine phosphate synthase [Acidobacteriota bacterium]|nr:thiamine phosphate synthase [Acidobacteriota bacterium]
MSTTFLEALAGTKLYPLTDRVISGLSHAEQIVQLSEAGANLVQLREKVLPSLEFYNEAARALSVARERRVKIIINDRVDIALALGADGVHLGQQDLPPAAARRVLGAEAIIGISTHNLEQALLAADMPVDYITIGPIFATATKQSINHPLGIQGLVRLREASGELPVVAIGGITAKNGESVLQAGADAIAIISDLWTSAGPLSARVENFIHRP